MKKIFIWLATLGPLGNFFGSGTLGSLVGAIFACLNNYFLNLYFQAMLIGFVAIMSLIIISQSKTYFADHDPKEIIIDEVVGCLVAYFGIRLNLRTVFLTFILFRFFDITKTCGIAYLENLFKGSFGILLDDLIAGLFANICVRIILISGLISE